MRQALSHPQFLFSSVNEEEPLSLGNLTLELRVARTP